MKKLMTIAILALVAMAGCKKNDGTDNGGNNKPQPKPETGVVINGVTWAKTNVDAPGTFAAKPEDTGMYYQWNRKTAWPATGDVTGWDSTNPEGDSWAAENDPCPTGWRVPTKDECTALCDTEKVTSEWDETLKGRKFTDKTSSKSIFIAVCGFRGNTAGGLSQVGIDGYYWTATPYSTTSSYQLYFGSKHVMVNRTNPSRSTTVRCVAK